MPKRRTSSVLALAAVAIAAALTQQGGSFASYKHDLKLVSGAEVSNGWLTRPRPSSQGSSTLFGQEHSSSLPRASLASGLTHIALPFSIYAAMWSGYRRLLQAPSASQEKGVWDQRRIWTALNVGNHGIYALLFLIRSFFYAGVGGNDRPFFFESFFLGWLCGPSWLMPSLLGWDGNMYNQPAVLKFVTGLNSAQSIVFPGWVAACVGSPAFMYLYQIAEGTFHLMICAGGLRAFFDSSWPPKRSGDSMTRLFRWGLWLEILVMDVAYVIAYSCLPIVSCPGHWGLTTIMMLIHHINVVPDIMCAWHEWKADKAATQVAEKVPALASA